MEILFALLILWLTGAAGDQSTPVEDVSVFDGGSGSPPPPNP